MDFPEPRRAAGWSFPPEVQEDRFQGWVELRQVQDDSVGGPVHEGGCREVLRDVFAGLREALPPPPTQDPRDVLARTWRVAAYDPGMVRPRGPVDDSKILGHSEPEGNGTSGG